MSDPRALDPFTPGSAELDPGVEEARRSFTARVPAGLAVDLTTLFRAQAGARARKVNERRLELLDRTAPILRAALAPGARIKLVAPAREQIWWEAYAGGYWAALMNRSILVATEQELLQIRCDRRSQPRMYVLRIPLSAIEKQRGFLANLTLRVAKDRRRFQLDRDERRELSALLPAAGKGAVGGVERLCPACFHASAEPRERCAACGLPFASSRTAFLRSLGVPGLGTWRLGAKGLGILQMVQTFIAWGLVALFLALGASGDMAGLVIGAGLAIFGVVHHCTAALISRALARRGHIALDARLPATPAPSGE